MRAGSVVPSHDLNLAINDLHLPLCSNQQVFDGVQPSEGSRDSFMLEGCDWQSHRVTVDHGNQVGVGSSDNGGESFIIFSDRSVDCAAEGCIKNGLCAPCEVLLDRSVGDISHERFLDAFGQDSKDAA
jgi:hypothetical protein